MKQNHVVAWSLLLFLPLLLEAQSITIQESSKSMDDYLHEPFQLVAGQYISINYADPHGAFTANRNNIALVTCYDTKLSQLYSTEISALAGKKYQGGMAFDNRLYIFFYNDKDVSVGELDAATGQLKGTSVQLFNTVNEPTKLLSGFSADSAYCYALFRCAPFKGKDEIVKGVIMDRKMNVLTKVSFELAEVKNYIDHTNCILSAQGELSVLNAVRVKTAKDDYRPLQYFFTVIDKQGSPRTGIVSGLPEGRLDNLVCTVAENGFNITGLLAKTAKEGFTTIFTGVFDFEEKKVVNQKQVPLTTEPYWKKIPGSMWRDGKQDGIPSSARLIKYFMDDNGDATLLLQQKMEIATFNGSYSYSDYYEGSIFIVKIKKGGTPGWIQLIPLYVMETPRPIYSGFLVFQQNKKDLYLLFHDLEKNTRRDDGDMPALVALDKSRVRSTRLVAVTIAPDGSKTSRVIEEKEDEDFHIAPHQPYTAYNGEMFCTSYAYKSAGRSSYKPVLIKLR